MKKPASIFLLFAATLIGCAGNPTPSGVVAPNTPIARLENDKAFALIKQGKYEEAETLLKKSIDADVTFGPARNNMGLVYYHQGKLYPAAWEFQNAIKLMPYQPEPRNNLGLVFETAGKLPEAAEAFEKARKMEPDNPQYIGNLARARLRKGDRDEETKKLLQELTFKDSRPDWRDWARMELIRFYSKPIDNTPVTPPGEITPPAPSLPRPSK